MNIMNTFTCMLLYVGEPIREYYSCKIYNFCVKKNNKKMDANLINALHTCESFGIKISEW